ncbi:unnamed protein product [Rangifer tarandus platyrhynchus]|uniref:Uncharacterized protein n=1 Tax=Rangifer tarandus platyrhynchus TaxID=3082113 RepID=A0AC59ZSP8_RANTA
MSERRPGEGGQLRAAFSIILTRERKSQRRTSSPSPAPATHPPAHLMPGSRVGEGEEPTQPR